MLRENILNTGHANNTETDDVLVLLYNTGSKSIKQVYLAVHK